MVSTAFVLVVVITFLKVEGGVIHEAIGDEFDLAAVAHNFLPPFIKGLYLQKAAEDLTSQQCPTLNTVHQTVGQCTGKLKDAFIVPHAAIFHEGVRCGTGKRTDYTIFVAGEKINDAKTADINGLSPLYGILSSNVRAKNAFQVLQGLDPVYVGIEYNGPRICGGKQVFEKNAIFMFVMPSPESKDLNFQFAYLGVLEIGMVTIKVNELLCLYKESRGLGPGQPLFSSPTPSPSPGRNTTLPANIFDLDDAANLEACFPAVAVEDVPRPSKPPRPSRTPTPTPSTSSSVSPTPSQTSGLERPTPSGTPAAKSASPSASASPGDNPDRDGTGDRGNSQACFCGSSTVQVVSGAVIAMSELDIGQKVLVGGGKYSEVFMFTHQTDDAVSRLIRLTVSTNLSVTLSPGHYISVSGRLRTARTVKAGDIVTLGNGRTDEIVAVEDVVRRGLYNPQTLDGDIVVDGIVASTFTEAVNPSTALPLLAPVKLLYSTGVVKRWAGYRFRRGNKFFADLVPNGPAVW